MPLIHRARDIAYYTPTKCGTVTAIRVLESCGFEFTVGDRHSMNPGLATKRFMQVRHPLERWVSMFWAIRRWTNSGQHPFLWQWCADPVEFANEWLRRRDHDPWQIYTDNLLECYTLCQAQGFFKMEDVADGALAVWAATAGAQYTPNGMGRCVSVPVTPHLNKTKDRPSVQETLDLLTPSQVQRIMEWASPDLEFFGYAGRECNITGISAPSVTQG